jgi:hypothetical protein
MRSSDLIVASLIFLLDEMGDSKVHPPYGLRPAVAAVRPPSSVCRWASYGLGGLSYRAGAASYVSGRASYGQRHLSYRQKQAGNAIFTRNRAVS